MSLKPILNTLETERLIPRPRSVSEAAIYHQLWTELEAPGPGLLAVQRKGTADVIRYCGLIAGGNGSPAEPESAHGHSLLTVRDCEPPTDG